MASAHSTKVYEARRFTRNQPIAIDGLTRDPAWESAVVLRDFSFPWSERVPPATEFRALCDDEGFCFRFDVTDADVVLGEGVDAKDKVIASDRAEIFFSSGPELNPYYGLEIDPRGEVLDYEARYHRQMNWEWTCAGLQARTSRTLAGYLVEGRISRATFVKLGCLHQDDVGEYLIAGLFRAEFSRDATTGAVVEDWLSWVDPQVPTPDFHVPTAFGIIRWGQ